MRLTGLEIPVTACVTEASSAPSVSDSSLQEAREDREAAQVRERLDSVQVSHEFFEKSLVLGS